MPVFASRDAEARFTTAYDAVLAQWPDDREQLRLSTGYGTTVVQVAGAPDGLPVVMLHGGGATAASWFATVPALAATCRVFAPDRPGEAGLSESGPSTIRERSDWTSWFGTVLDRLGLDRVALVGHSYGGWIATSFAAQAPHRVSHLALLDPTACFRGGRLGYNLRAVPLFLRPTAERMRSFLQWETGGRPPPEPLLSLLASATEDFAAERVVLPTRPSDEALAAIDARVLLVLPSGSRQNDPARTAAAARARVPHVEVVTLEDQTHHTVPAHAPQALNAALAGFLRP